MHAAGLAQQAASQPDGEQAERSDATTAAMRDGFLEGFSLPEAARLLLSAHPAGDGPPRWPKPKQMKSLPEEAFDSAAAFASATALGSIADAARAASVASVAAAANAAAYAATPAAMAAAASAAAAASPPAQKAAPVDISLASDCLTDMESVPALPAFPPPQPVGPSASQPLDAGGRAVAGTGASRRMLLQRWRDTAVAAELNVRRV